MSNLPWDYVCQSKTIYLNPRHGKYPKLHEQIIGYKVCCKFHVLKSQAIVDDHD